MTTGWKHLTDSTPVARKSHVCELCHRVIPVGETYVRRNGVSEGNLVSFAMHAICESKTHDWDDMDWEANTDPFEFRHYELGERE